MNRLTVCGSFGFGNTGDEAVLPALQDLARAAGIEVSFDLVGRYADPNDKAVIGLGPQDAGRRAGLRGQPVIFTGGGIIHGQASAAIWRLKEHVGEWNPAWRALFAASADPGTRLSWLAPRRLRRMVADYRSLLMRDAVSAETLQAIVPRREVETVGDVVLWLRAAEDIPEAIESFQPFVAVCLAPCWDDDPRWPEWMGTHLRTLAHRLRANLLFVPFSTRFDDDRRTHWTVIERIRRLDAGIHCQPIEAELSPRQLAGILGKARLVVGMRLHACVMAFAQQVPFASIVYHPKLSAFLRTVGWEHAAVPGESHRLTTTSVAGFRPEELGLYECDLASIASRMVEDPSFGALERFRSRLKDAFVALAGSVPSIEVGAQAGASR